MQNGDKNVTENLKTFIFLSAPRAGGRVTPITQTTSRHDMVVKKISPDFDAHHQFVGEYQVVDTKITHALCAFGLSQMSSCWCRGFDGHLRLYPVHVFDPLLLLFLTGFTGSTGWPGIVIQNQPLGGRPTVSNQATPMYFGSAGASPSRASCSASILFSLLILSSAFLTGFTGSTGMGCGTQLWPRFRPNLVFRRYCPR